MPRISKLKTPAKQNRRGSPEAIEKRRAARLFNDVLGGKGGASALDGRTQKRRLRLLRELEEGKARNRELKPLDILQRVQELLELGESLASIRKVAKVRKSGAEPSPSADGVVDVVARLHEAYGFKAETYRFVGVGDDVLRAAGVLAAPGRSKTRGRKRV